MISRFMKRSDEKMNDVSKVNVTCCRSINMVESINLPEDNMVSSEIS